MMRIPYVKIMEIRSLKDYLDKSDIPKISKWFYNRAYNFQCKPILKLLKKTKDNINQAINQQIFFNYHLVSFLFVYLTDLNSRFSNKFALSHA